MSSRPLSSRLQRISKYPAARAGLIEHRLIGEVSPMVALAMTIPAGAKYSAGDGDYGQVAAAYKHVLLRGTEGETKISFARKADLRPSPISTTLSQDLLTLHANFHINYLPEILETFKKMFIRSPEREPEQETTTTTTGEPYFLGVSEFDLNGEIRDRVELDGNIATSDSNTILLQAAQQLAFHSPNRLYFPATNPSPTVTPKDLDNFHQQTLERAKSNQSNFSFLISVNDSNLLSSTEFIETVKSCDIPVINERNDNVKSFEKTTIPVYFGGNCVRIENVNSCSFDEFLIAMPVRLGGFNQQNYWNSLIFEALLKRSFPIVISSVTSNTSLLSIHLKGSNYGSDFFTNKKLLQQAFQKLQSISEHVTDEELLWAYKRANFNHLISIDSRDSRLLTFAHHFAFSGNFPSTASEPFDSEKLRESLKDTLNSKPTLIARGNPKKLIYYEDLFYNFKNEEMK